MDRCSRRGCRTGGVGNLVARPTDDLRGHGLYPAVPTIGSTHHRTGHHHHIGLGETVEAPVLSYADHILNVIPDNIVKPFLEGNVLSLLLLAFAIGIGLSKLPESENKSVVVKGFLGLQELLHLLIRGLIWTLPLGIVAFSAQLSAQVSAGVVADSIGKYVLVVLGGNVIQFFVILPLFLLARGLNPIHVLGRMMPAVLMALFTKSSAATLPVTMETAENRLGIRKGVSRFVLPICTTTPLG